MLCLNHFLFTSIRSNQPPNNQICALFENKLFPQNTSFWIVELRGKIKEQNITETCLQVYLYTGLTGMFTVQKFDANYRYCIQGEYVLVIVRLLQNNCILIA